MRIYPYQIAPQTFTGLVLTLVDISNLRHTEASLAERNQLHSSLLSTLPEVYLLIDAKGCIRETNQSVTEILGYTIDELIGQNVSMLISGQHAAEHDGYIERYLQTGETRVVGKTRLVNARHKQGHPLALVLSVTRIEIGDEIFFAGMMRPPIEQAGSTQNT